MLLFPLYRARTNGGFVPPPGPPTTGGGGPGLGRRKKHRTNTQIVFHGDVDHSRSDTLEADLRRAIYRAFNVPDDAAPAVVEAAAEIREIVAPDYSKSFRPVVDLVALAEAEQRAARILEIDATLRQLLAIKSGLDTLLEIRAREADEMDEDDAVILLLLQ